MPVFKSSFFLWKLLSTLGIRILYLPWLKLLLEDLYSPRASVCTPNNGRAYVRCGSGEGNTDEVSAGNYDAWPYSSTQYSWY